MPNFKWQLTNCDTKENLQFIEDQLKKGGAKEGRDYIWVKRGKKFIIRTTGKEKNKKYLKGR